MTLVTKATRGAVGTNNWTNPANATADDGVYATAAPAKNSSVIGDWDFAAFSDAELPIGATINSVTIRAQYKVSTAASVASLGVQAGNNGAFDAEETHTTEPTVDTDFDVVFNTAPTETDLKTAGRLVARIRGIRGNSNNAVTFSLDYVELRVDYSTISPTRGLISWAEAEAPFQATRGRVSFAELEAPFALTRGLISWAEQEAPSPPADPTRGLISWVEFEAPDLQPTRGLVSWAEFETVLAPTRGRVSFGELEVSLVSTRGLLAWAELETPNVGEVYDGVWLGMGPFGW